MVTPASWHDSIVNVFVVLVDVLMQLVPSLRAFSSILPQARSKRGTTGVDLFASRIAASSLQIKEDTKTLIPRWCRKNLAVGAELTSREQKTRISNLAY